MKTKVMVIGFGFMGQTHAGSLLKTQDAELAAIVDPVDPKERLQSITGNRATERISPDEIGSIPHFPNLDEALSASCADAAVIALPTKLHHDSVIQCLKAGLHVMVEKPLSISLADCERMVLTAGETNKLLAVGYVVRWMKEYQFLKQTIDSGRLGKLKYLKLSRITGIPNWGNWNDPEFIRASGGSLFDLVSHDIDFARFCLGEPDRIESVKNLGASQFKMISSVMRFRDADAAVEGGFVTPAGYPFRRTFAAYFENGTLFSSESGKVTEYRKNEDAVEHDFRPDNPYFTEIEDFIRAVRSGDASPVCSGSDALGTIKCCTQIAQEIGFPIPEKKEQN